MTRYFFDSHDGEHFVRDDEGQELDGPETAARLAREALGDLARDAIPRSEGRELSIEVRDDSRQLFRAALWFEMQKAAS